MSREDTYARLTRAGGFFHEDAGRKLQPGGGYELKTTTGENYNGQVKFVSEGRGFCLSVTGLNDALFWLTLECAPGKIEAQIWLSAFGFSERGLAVFQEKWSRRLQEIFA